MNEIDDRSAVPENWSYLYNKQHNRLKLVYSDTTKIKMSIKNDHSCDSGSIGDLTKFLKEKEIIQGPEEVKNDESFA